VKEIVWTSVIKSFSFRRLTNIVKVGIALGLSILLKKVYVWGKPFILTIEPTVSCNLRCPQCLAGLGKIERFESFMPFELYKHIIDYYGKDIWYLLLYNQGEPFLHNRLIHFIRLAKEKRIYVTVSTNGHFFREEKFVEQLTLSGIDSIIISLDGADAVTYSRYRQGGNFDQVCQGIKNVIITRRKLRKKTPLIFLQFLIMRHNEHQLEDIQKLRKSLGVDRILFKTMQIEDFSTAQHYLPTDQKWQRYHIERNSLKLIKLAYRCDRLWYSTVILSDGRIVPCCFDKNGKYSFGNIKTEPLNKIWTSHAYRKFRQRVIQNRYKIEICRNCSQNQKIFL